MCIDIGSTNESFTFNANSAQEPNNFHNANYDKSAKV